MGNTDKQIEAHEKALQALELRKAGVPYRDIATRLGYNSFQAAWKAVKSALKRTLQEPSDEVRKMEVERLDAVLMAIWAQVKQGNLSAVDRYIKVAQRRAELLGLDAPKRVDVTSDDKPLQFDYAKFINTATRPVEDSNPPGQDESSVHGETVGKDSDGGSSGSGGE